jgi:Ca2+-transporting ATPase
MGKTGTEVTKEVADMILTDDNFATIVIAVEEGRKIYTNIQKTIQFLLSCNIAEVFAILMLTLIYPSVTFLVAVQILFINLVTDTLPAISLGMEEAERDVMERKPRSQKQSVIGGRVGFNLVYQGIVQALLVVGVFVLAKNLYGNEIAATMGFLTLNLLQLIHMFSVRTNNSIFKSNPLKNKTMILSLIVGVGLVLTISFVPFIAGIFHLQILNWQQWLIILGFAFMIVPIVEIVKLIQKVVMKKKS